MEYILYLHVICRGREAGVGVDVVQVPLEAVALQSLPQPLSLRQISKVKTLGGGFQPVQLKVATVALLLQIIASFHKTILLVATVTIEHGLPVIKLLVLVHPDLGEPAGVDGDGVHPVGDAARDGVRRGLPVEGVQPYVSHPLMLIIANARHKIKCYSLDHHPSL